MEQNPEANKYAKAKIEEPNLTLPDFLQIPSDSSSNGNCFMKFSASEVDSGQERHRKVYRVRNKDLFEILGEYCEKLKRIQINSNITTALLADVESEILRHSHIDLVDIVGQIRTSREPLQDAILKTFKILGENCENMKQIQRVSKASIELLSDAESDYHNHSYINLVGTIDQVKTAEELILDNILKTYDSQVYPVILMPPIIHGKQVTITMPLNKVGCFIGPNGSNLVKLEMESRAWITIDIDSSEVDIVVNVHGPREHVIKALSLIKSEIYKLAESSEAEVETEGLFKKLQCGEKADSENSGGTSEPENEKKQIQAEETTKIDKQNSKLAHEAMQKGSGKEADSGLVLVHQKKQQVVDESEHHGSKSSEALP